MSEHEKEAAGGQVQDVVRQPRFHVNAERRVERIAELEAERRWHFAEIESAEATIKHHYRNIRDIEDQIDALKKEAV